MFARVEGRVNESKRRSNASVQSLVRRRRTTCAVRAVQLAALALAWSLLLHGMFFHWVAINPFHEIESALPFVIALVSVMLVVEILFPSALSQLLE